MVAEELVQPAKNETSSLSVKDLFYKYIRFLPLFIVCIALSLFVAYIYLRYATLVYQATGTMVIKDDKGPGSSGNDKLEQLMVSNGQKNIQNEIEYLRSRPLMERVVRALNLNFEYIAKGKIKELNVYKTCPFQVEAFEISDSANAFNLNLKFESENSFRIGGEAKHFSFGQVFKNQYGVFRITKISPVAAGSGYKVIWQPTAWVASYLVSNLVIAPKQGTGILVISKEADNPYLAANVINQLMEEYQHAVIEDKNDATRKTLAFIDSRLNVVQHELDSINTEIIVFKKKNNIIDPGAQSSHYFSRIEEARKEAEQQQVQLSNAELIDQYLRDKGLAYTPVPSSLGLVDPTLNAMINGYNQSQLERKGLLENAPSGNVAVQQKEQEIEVLRQKILESLKNLKSAYHNSISKTQSSGGVAQSQIASIPEKEQALNDIIGARQTKLLIYNSLLQKKEESAIALASQISDTKVLQDAQPSLTPIKPNRRSTQLLAIVVGIVIPALFIFVLELMNDKVTTKNDIERFTSASILGEVGHSYGKEALVVTSKNRSVVAEQFRILRSNLHYVLNHVSKPVIMITSSFSGEGKSFISANVGAVMALTGKKTIILEFDIRKPKILSHLNIAKRPGLTNYLLGKVELQDLPYPVPGNENLFVLPCGPIPPNPSELLLDPKFNELFDYLKRQFDVVIMDTAPVGMVSDAMTLSKYADCTLYIVRQGHTFKKQIGLINEYYLAGKLPKISIVLNDIKLRAAYGYYGYGRYGYGQAYGSGYFDDDTPSSGMLGQWFGWLSTNKRSKKKRKRTTV